MGSRLSDPQVTHELISAEGYNGVQQWHPVTLLILDYVTRNGVVGPAQSRVAGCRYARGGYFGNGAPPPSARTVATVLRIAAAAVMDAIAIERTLDVRLDMALTPFEPDRRLQTRGYAQTMRKSTITKHTNAGPRSSFAVALGKEIRRRRVARGLSQARAAEPLGRAFLSRVEQGQVVPSLPSLLIVARRLDTSAADILLSVEWELDHD